MDMSELYGFMLAVVMGGITVFAATVGMITRKATDDDE